MNQDCGHVQAVGAALRISVVALLVALAAQSVSAWPQGRHLRLRDLLGTWKDKDGSTVVIRKTDGAHLLLIGKGERQWEGDYRDGVLRFTRKPEPDEIHPSVPDWAPKDRSVAGTLMWRIELKPGVNEDG